MMATPTQQQRVLLYQTEVMAVHQNGTSVNFVSPNQIFDTAQYGSAGAGGSGGGWSEDTLNYPDSGGGSQGQSGYVYINWVKYKN